MERVRSAHAFGLEDENQVKVHDAVNTMRNMDYCPIIPNESDDDFIDSIPLYASSAIIGSSGSIILGVAELRRKGRGIRCCWPPDKGDITTLNALSGQSQAAHSTVEQE